VKAHDEEQQELEGSPIGKEEVKDKKKEDEDG
jgi:hypothetical protein